MRIGEFAKRNAVTVRALRHYEQMGLLVPDRVDEATGYRYYRARQSLQLQRIMTLKQLGFSLGEITGLLSGPLSRDELLRVLGDRLLRVRYEMDRARTERLGLEALLNRVRERPDGIPIDLKEENLMSFDETRESLPMEEQARFLYEQAWQRSEQSGAPLSALVLDVDRMLHINQTYGREAGDEIIQRIVHTAIAVGKDCCSHSFLEHGNRCFLTRQGGDEFIMTLEGMDAGEALALAGRVCDAVGKIDFAYAGCAEPVTVSAGVADRQYGPRSPHELIHEAETAMMDAKTRGRGLALAYRP